MVLGRTWWISPQHENTFRRILEYLMKQNFDIGLNSCIKYIPGALSDTHAYDLEDDIQLAITGVNWCADCICKGFWLNVV